MLFVLFCFVPLFHYLDLSTIDRSYHAVNFHETGFKNAPAVCTMQGFVVKAMRPRQSAPREIEIQTKSARSVRFPPMLIYWFVETMNCSSNAASFLLLLAAHGTLSIIRSSPSWLYPFPKSVWSRTAVVAFLFPLSLPSKTVGDHFQQMVSGISCIIHHHTLRFSSSNIAMRTYQSQCVVVAVVLKIVVVVAMHRHLRQRILPHSDCSPSNRVRLNSMFVLLHTTCILNRNSKAMPERYITLEETNAEMVHVSWQEN